MMSACTDLCLSISQLLQVDRVVWWWDVGTGAVARHVAHAV